MAQPEFSVMTEAQLDAVLDWAAAEGWNPGLGDAAAFHAADPQGFFLASVDGQPAAAISVVNQGPEDAFLGLYICRPEFRGQGIGFALWSHALTHVGTRSVGLDGVPEQEANYESSGFVRVGASLRHVGHLPGVAGAGLRDMTEQDLPDLIALDAAAGGLTRAAFLASWLGASPQRATRVLCKDDQIAGFATWRTCREGTKIGPIIAPDADAALTLIADIAAVAPAPLIIDIPEANFPLRTALTAAGFEMTFSTARMYRGRPPVTTSSLQAIASMELG
ncbi:MAG: GNAT family N-acetyltransferase [Rhodobacteraceae bacterium]|nr:GNAT family N-acetyltransferase [Paracoccaceae bacterium]